LDREAPPGKGSCRSPASTGNRSRQRSSAVPHCVHPRGRSRP
jgi:hypothetical protein